MFLLGLLLSLRRNGLLGLAHAFGLTEPLQKAFCESGGTAKVRNPLEPPSNPS